MASKSFHSLHSNTYDRMASNGTLNIAKIVIDDLPLPITPDSHILDNACGTGLVSLLIKTQYPFARITGTDLAPGMIDFFKSRATEEKWENVDTDILDVRDLKTLKDGTFSHVITNFGFAPDTSDLEGPGRASKEVWRVLREGGVAVTTIWAERNFNEALTAAARVIRPHEEPYNWNLPEDWNRGSWLMRNMEDAGFGHKVAVKSVEGRVQAGSLEELVGNMMLFKDMFFKGYTEEEMARLPEVISAEIQKLEAYEKTDVDVGIKMVAWVGYAWK